MCKITIYILNNCILSKIKLLNNLSARSDLQSDRFEYKHFQCENNTLKSAYICSISVISVQSIRFTSVLKSIICIQNIV